jgi:redox-sensitive bicupin YhaK (pirin superfamily)
MKKLIQKQTNAEAHWVGDGFPVRTIFHYNNLAKILSPFLLMDYAGPAEFPPTDKKLGVGEHPHRGFETVTVVYSGQVEHRDSAGGGGIIGAGDVQWMTAASGLVHEEFHGRDFARSGGLFEMVQLWVNLPRKDKMTKPRYQSIRSETIPTVALTQGAGVIRVIAGEYQNKIGPAKTFSPINLWDIKLKAGGNVTLDLPPNQTTSVFVLSGKIFTAESEMIGPAELGLFETEGNLLPLRAEEDSVLLFLGGEPLNEPIVGYGPFVMNSPAEIKQAFTDYQLGKMGSLEPIEGAE